MLDFPGTSFQRLIGDRSVGDKVKKVLFCSGKIYYELVQERKAQEMEDTVAIVRTEQVHRSEYFSCIRNFPSAIV